MCSPRAGILLAATLALAGCRSSSDPPGAPSGSTPWSARPCPATHQADGPACLPRFDACGPSEVPKLGSGCTRVGVDVCPEGFAADGAGGCDIVVPASCAFDLLLPGECAALAPCDWVPPSGALRVEPGAFATIGAALAAAKDGDTIAIAAGTYDEDVIVDRAVTLRGVCPAKVLVRGVAAGAAITVRANATIRGLAISGPVRGLMLEDTDATLAELHVHDTGELGIGARAPSASIAIRRVLVERTKDAGIAANGAKLDVEDAVIRDVGDGPGVLPGYGFYVGGSTSPATIGEAHLRRVVVSRAGAGIVALGASLSVERAWVHDVDGIGLGMPNASPLATNVSADGVLVEDTGSFGISAMIAPLAVRRATVRRTGASGILVVDGDANVEATKVTRATSRGISTDGSNAKVTSSLVLDTRAVDGRGCGLCASAAPSAGKKLELIDVLSSDNAIGGVGVDGVVLAIDGARIERNGRLGVSIAAADATLQRVLLRDTRAESGLRGDGIFLASGDERLSRLQLFDAWIERSAASGIAVLGEARIERVIVRDTHASTASGANGVGLVIAPPSRTPRPPRATLLDVLLERSEQAGLFVGSGKVDVARSVVRDTRANAAGAFGDGIVYSAQGLVVGSDPVAATGTIDECLIEGSARAGISLFGSAVHAGRTLLSCNGIPLDLEESFGPSTAEHHAVSLTDDGGMACSCGAEAAICRAVSMGLAPIPAAAP